MQRLLELDGIRAVAIIAIMICHISYGIEPCSWVGQYLGGTYNCVFFLISALLFGCKFTLSGEKIHAYEFMKKRIVKLAESLWPFLLICIVIYLILGINFSWRNAVLNFLMLGWFAKLPGLGHLWFVTMMVLCYCIYIIINYLTGEWKRWLLILLIAAILLQFVTEHYGLPSYAFLMLIYCGVVFLYPDKLLRFTRSINIWILFVASIIVNAIVLYALYSGILCIGHLSYYYMTTLTGVSSFMLLYRLFAKFKPKRILVFVSSISYELYLVHHPLAGVKLYSCITGGNVYIAIILVFVVSIVLAYLLNKISHRLLVLLKN